VRCSAGITATVTRPERCSRRWPALRRFELDRVTGAAAVVEIERSKMARGSTMAR
jgi:hypothetical protein